MATSINRLSSELNNACSYDYEFYRQLHAAASDLGGHSMLADFHAAIQDNSRQASDLLCVFLIEYYAGMEHDRGGRGSAHGELPPTTFTEAICFLYLAELLSDSRVRDMSQDRIKALLELRLLAAAYRFAFGHGSTITGKLKTADGTSIKKAMLVSLLAAYRDGRLSDVQPYMELKENIKDFSRALTKEIKQHADELKEKGLEWHKLAAAV